MIDAELERIEQQVELIREESAVSGRPDLLSMRLDAVTESMAETSRWIDEHSDFFDSISGQVTGEPGSLLELPPLPAEPTQPPLPSKVAE